MRCVCRPTGPEPLGVAGAARCSRRWRPPTARGRASGFIRRQPLSSRKRTAASATGFSPASSARRMAAPSAPISARDRKRVCPPSGSRATPRAGFSLMAPRRRANSRMVPGVPAVQGRDAPAARGGAAAPAAALRRRLAGGDVRLQPGEVLGRQARDGAPAEQRLDVARSMRLRVLARVDAFARRPPPRGRSRTAPQRSLSRAWRGARPRGPRPWRLRRAARAR